MLLIRAIGTMLVNSTRRFQVDIGTRMVIAATVAARHMSIDSPLQAVATSNCSEPTRMTFPSATTQRPVDLSNEQLPEVATRCKGCDSKPLSLGGRGIINTRNAIAGQIRRMSGQPPNVSVKQTIAARNVAVSRHS